MDASMKRDTDLLIAGYGAGVRRRVHGRSSANRPVVLEEFLNSMARELLAPSAPALASFVAEKVLQGLERSGMVGGSDTHPGVLPLGMEAALHDAVIAKAGYSSVAASVKRLANMLTWRCGLSGPYASLNFEHAHAYGVVAGPGGFEDRADIRVGITFMKSYSRFPDHVQSQSRAYLLLS